MAAVLRGMSQALSGAAPANGRAATPAGVCPRPRPAPKPPLCLVGIKVYDSSTDYRAVHNLQLSRFDGMRWAAIGDMTDLDDPAT